MQKHLVITAVFLLHLLGNSNCKAQNSWQKYTTNRSVSYKEAVTFYHEMAKKHANTRVFNYGKTDGGMPLELFVISNAGFDRSQLRKKGICVLLINNGIHAGEPDGIDASIKLTHDILSGKIHLPDHLVIAIIPVYNIDGSLNSGCCSRVNQNGPEQVGFRANSKNLDLNRDFIKCDSRNAFAFTSLYHAWDPDVFVDTHVSDGADYQHIITLIDSQKDKLQPVISTTMQQQLLPLLYLKMKTQGFQMCPYVNEKEDSPDKGIVGFLETPRFASGYSALFNAFPFVVETHMLKPFPERVESTYIFLKAMIESCDTLAADIIQARKKANTEIIKSKTYPLSWVNDTIHKDSILFCGYSANYKKSSVTGLDQLYYDRSQPYQKYIPYFNSFMADTKIEKPLAYVIPQAWQNVIERLKWNGVKIYTLPSDTLLNVEVYYISDYKTVPKPYEGHYLHSDVKTTTKLVTLRYFKGDIIVYCNQPVNRYIIETLEPKGTDSFFAWNFFDSILQQKEWFSDYVFDSKAEEILAQNPQLKSDFEQMKQNDTSFAKNRLAMLIYIYQHSEYYESTHNRYPISRLQ